ncbi:TPA: DUF551 domain-containing protein [Klebsiella pneumoniae]|nr:DUF551 domain-containing protein [Klebsiella pneumoniae]HCB1096562.1 DUF551 domain-containing protein [Klebsiella pneumoniae]
MTSKLTRDRLQEIAEDGFLKHGESKELARMALAAMDSEPFELPLDYLQGHKDGLEWAAQLAEANHPETGDWLYDDPIELAKAIRKGPDMPPSQPALDTELVAYTDERNLGYIDRGRETAYLWGKQNSEASDVALYRHAQLAPASPVCTCPSGDGSLRWPCPVHPGNSPAIPDGYVMVPKEMTDEIGEAIAMQANCCGGIALDIYDAMLAAAPQSPGSEPATVPGKWIPVSERMPEMGEKQRYVLAADFKNNYWPNIPNTQVGVYGDWFDDGNPTWDDGDGEDLHLKEVTHWMPLPAGPQEVR